MTRLCGVLMRENSFLFWPLTLKKIPMKTLIVIPARMASTRLPGKPLADIHGKPMIVHVYERALAAKVGPVIVACAETEIADAIKAAGGEAMLTDPDLPSGTDRVRVAADIFDAGQDYDIVVNVQGDMPTLDPAIVANVVSLLKDKPDADIATAVVYTTDSREISDPNVVKAILAEDGRALYFTRASAPTGQDENGHQGVWHHVGLYAYRRAALNRFCELTPSPLEKRERLEQLRALEDGMTIYAARLETAPDGVDTPGDLERAKKTLSEVLGRMK